jgi:hypothetical protein
MASEIIEGEYVDQQPQALAVVPPVTGTYALAMQSDEEFDRNLAAIRQGQRRISRMQEELLVKGVDYANIPNVDKPSLGKPGAEKLCVAYGLAARVETALVMGDGVTRPLITYDATCFLHLGSLDGPVVGVGHGTCNSWESKYRYRNADRICPKCKKPTIIKGRQEYGGGWLCFAKKGGCGAKFNDGDLSIEGQATGQIENPDPYDLANTIMKMAEKRSHVDATLRTTAASGIFTQDVEDNVGAEPATPGAPAAAPEPKAKPPARNAAKAAPARSNEPPALDDAELDSLFGDAPSAATAAPAPKPVPAANAHELFVAALRRAAIATDLPDEAGTFSEEQGLALRALGLPNSTAVVGETFGPHKVSAAAAQAILDLHDADPAGFLAAWKAYGEHLVTGVGPGAPRR